jgi:predicted small lipoprotein YifL
MAMLKNFQKSFIVRFSFLIMLAFFFSGCGKKGPPKPPKKEKLHTASQQLKHC